MSENVIHVDGDAAIAVLDEHGWTKGIYEGSGGAVCLHGLRWVRVCRRILHGPELVQWEDACEQRAALARVVGR